MLDGLMNFLIGVLTGMNEALLVMANAILDWPAVVIPWPFPWLPYQPVVVAFAIAGLTTMFLLGVKALRWVYGMTPLLQ